MQKGHAVSWVGRAGAPAAQPSPASHRWSPARLRATEALWGPGYKGPGGPPETLRVARPLELTRNTALLLLGGGMGGPAETLVETFGNWVRSFEADDELVSLADQRRNTHRLATRMSVAAWQAEQPGFSRQSAHHAMALEAFRGAPAAPVIKAIAEALMPRGHFVLVDLVSERIPADTDREFAAWCRLENRAPSLPRMEEVSGALTQHGFDLQVVEDMSDRHVAMTLSGWRAAVKSMAEGPKPDSGTASVFVTEAELWLLRVRLMRRLGLRLLRWHAVASA